MEYITVSHDSIPIFINEDSSILILGSIPSIKSREVGFYYGHKQNRFFPLLASIFDEPIPITVSDRKAFLKRNHIALYDVIYKCDIKGSSDSSIKNVVPIDIVDILNRFPNIKKIILNGGKAKSLFDKYLLQYCRGVSIYYCSSTSPANAKMDLSSLIEEYKKAIIE